MSKKNGLKSESQTPFWKSYINLLMIAAPVFVALVMLVLWTDPVSPNILSLSFFIAGLSGLIIIIRREIPMAIYTIKDSQAIIGGSIFTLIFWAGALFILLYRL